MRIGPHSHARTSSGAPSPLKSVNTAPLTMPTCSSVAEFSHRCRAALKNHRCGEQKQWLNTGSREPPGMRHDTAQTLISPQKKTGAEAPVFVNRFCLLVREQTPHLIVAVRLIHRHRIRALRRRERNPCSRQVVGVLKFACAIPADHQVRSDHL